MAREDGHDGVSRLEKVVAVGADLGEVDGNRCTLTAIDVWSDGFELQTLWRPEHPLFRESGPPGGWDWAARWKVVDDLGAEYALIGQRTTGGGVAAMLESTEYKAPPRADARTLKVSFQHDDGVAEAQAPLERQGPAGDLSRNGRDGTQPDGGLVRYQGTIPVAADLGVVGKDRVWFVAVDVAEPWASLRFAYVYLWPLAEGELRPALPRIEWSLSDDVGTPYEWHSAGGDRRWFSPSPPAAATTLTVTGDWQGQVTLQHQVSLEGFRSA